MADLDPYSLLMGEEPDAKAQAQAYAAALRGQRQLSDIEQLSGNPTLAAAGQHGAQEYGQGQQQLGKLLMDRLERQTQAKHYADEQQYRQGELDYRNKALTSDLWVPTSNRNGDTFLVNRHTGETRQIDRPRVDANGNVIQPNKAGSDEKTWEAFSKAISKTQGRANLSAEDEKRVRAIERLEGYAFDESGNPKPLNPQGVEAAATDFASVLSGGGAPTEGQIKAQTPHTWKGSLANTLQFTLAHPEDAGAQEFLKYLHGQMGELKGTIGKQVLRGQVSQLPHFYKTLRPSDPDTFDAQLKANGIDQSLLDERGNLKEPAPGAKPNIRARLVQLRNSGATPVAIKAALRKEYSSDEIKAAVSG